MVAEGKKKIETQAKVLRCPNCGASDAEYDISAGGLRCAKCRTIFVSPKINALGGVDELVGEIKSEGADDIEENDFVVTFRCPSCGANVMLKKDAKNAECHWCRHSLKMSQRIPNGAMPDMILPFKLTRKEALSRMKSFTRERSLFAFNNFAKTLTEESIVGVYLPYAVIDVRAHVEMAGRAEKTVGVRLVMEGSRYKDEPNIVQVYDVSSFGLKRDFDLELDDLTIEASSEKLEYGSLINTTHIINSIMPFDTEEAVEWDARYLEGFSSEKRDLNIKQLNYRLKSQIMDIAKYKMMSTTIGYDRGACWDKINIEERGIKWKTAYFPVWLYSYVEGGIGKKNAIHYIAVNARTGETMGSVPLKAWVRTIISGIPLLTTLWFVVDTFRMCLDGGLSKRAFVEIIFPVRILAITILIAITVSTMKLVRRKTREYRNTHARHMYEVDTCMVLKDLKREDAFEYTSTRRDRTMISGYNEERRLGAHDSMMHDDALEEATGIKTSSAIMAAGYLVLGVLLFGILAMLGLLVASVVDFAH